MNAQTKMLLWKEWRERRGQLWLCLAWIGAVPLAALLWGESLLNICIILALPYSLSMPIFVAMRTALGETTDRGGAFSAGLPIAARRQGALRLAGGWATLILPLLVGGAIVAGYNFWATWPGTAHDPHRSVLGVTWSLLGAVAAVSWLTTALYIFLSLLGTRAESEFRFGLISVAVTILWAMNLVVGFAPYPLIGVSPAIRLCASAITPNTWVMHNYCFRVNGHLREGGLFNIIVAPLAANALLLCLAATLFVRRYGRPRAIGGERRWPRIQLGPRLRFPSVRTPGAALAWLTLRQTVPLCLPGLGVACLLALICMLLDTGMAAEHEKFADFFGSFAGMIAILWAAIVGAGTFSEEIDARVGQSWRSWPISVGRFFVIKYLVGMVAVLAVLDGPALAVAWQSGVWRRADGVNLAYVECLLPLHAMLYSIALAWSCVLRRSTVGAMIAFVSYLLVAITLDSFDATARYEPFHAYGVLSDHDLTGPGANYPVIVSAIGLTVLLSAAAAYRALARFDAPRPWRRVVHSGAARPVPTSLA